MIATMLLLAAAATAPIEPPEVTGWWSVYGDSELSRLVELALKNNLDIATATQRIAEARAAAGVSRAKLAPEVNFTGGVQRLRGGFQQGVIRIPQPSGAIPGGSFVAPFETGLLQGGLDMKWELDLFGSNRAGLAAARADAAAEFERRQDAAITVSAEVARYYIQMRGTEERIAITKQNLEAQRELLSLTRQRVEAGLDSQLDVERQQVLLSNTEASLAPLESDLAAQRHRIAVLVGDEAYSVPAAVTGTPQPNAPTAEGEIPSELLKRRPDVRAAEARLAAASARLKQARTDLYPKINLNGLVGRQSTSFTGLSLGGGNFFNIGPQVQLPIFSSGRIRANIDVNAARMEQERIAYRNELLIAFEEAANALTALRQQRERESKLAEAAAAARSSLALSQDLQRAGLNDFLTVLDAQRSSLDADFARSSARTQALLESVNLYKALAGSWPGN
jgi:multidrug efflux system outer membrane protein